MFIRKPILIPLLLALTNQACSVHEELDRKANLASADAEGKLSALNSKGHHDDNWFRSGGGVWTGNRLIKARRSDSEKLPASMDRQVTFNYAGGGEIEDMLARLTHDVGITVRAEPDVLRGVSPRTGAGGGGSSVSAQGGAAGGNSGGGSGSSGGSSGSLPALPSPGAGSGGSASAGGFTGHGLTPDLRVGLPPLPLFASNWNGGVSYTGSLSGLFTEISRRAAAHWRYRDGQVTFYRYETKVFSIHSLPGLASTSTNMSASSSSGGGGGASGGGSGSAGGSSGGGGGSSSSGTASNSSEIAFAAQISPWSSLQSTVGSMLTSDGTMSLNEATGTLTVRDLPEVLELVKEYIDTQNAAMTRQVVVNVKLLVVEKTNTEQGGLDWELLFRDATRLGIQVGSAVNPAIAGAGALIANFQKGDFAGNASVTLLNGQGKTTLLDEVSVTTLNNQPEQVSVGDDYSYLAQVSAALVANAGVQNTASLSQFTTGLNMTVLPHITADNRVILQYGISIKALKELRKVSTGTGDSSVTLESPNLAVRNIANKVGLRNGQSLILTGFAEDSGALAQDYALGGGHSRADTGRKTWVIVITPVIIS